MIVVRLILLSIDIRNAMNAPFRISGLYKAIITIIGESCALYAAIFFYSRPEHALPTNPFSIFSSHFSPRLRFVVFLYFLDALQSRDVVSNYDNGQAIVLFLTTLQVANRRESASDVVSGTSVRSLRVEESQRVTVGPPLVSVLRVGWV